MTDERLPSDLTRLSVLLRGWSPTGQSAVYRLVMHLAVRLADDDISDEEMRFIRLVTDALVEIADRVPPPD